MSSRFGQFFWGLLLVVLDFRINNFDLLPDLVGYIVIMLGCAGLNGVSANFSKARVLAGILVVLEVIQLINPTHSIPFNLFCTVVDVCMIWYLLGGIMDHAMARERLDLRMRASNRRVVYVVLIALLTLLGLAQIENRDFGSVLSVGLVVGVLSVDVMILHLIHRVQLDLSGGSSS